MIRHIRSIIPLLALFWFAAPGGLRAQIGLGAEERYVLDGRDTTIVLPTLLVVPGSVRLALDDTLQLAEGLDYSLSATADTVFLLAPLRARLDSSRRTVLIRYRYLPISLQRSYAQRTLVERRDSSGVRREVAESTASPFSPSALFGRDFQRSGSLVRGVTVGSNRDLTVQSGLRLQFSGRVADSVEVAGALVDEQTPIQPDGTTQTLREVDNIFFEVRSPVARGTLGKFMGEGGVGEYSHWSRRVQGVTATGVLGPAGTTQVVAAVSPGRFRNQFFQGREGDQGPYRLTGDNGERTIVAVAGTERVYVDGVAMTRGENNDYIIDYAAAEIVFRPRRPITAASRITVDFEYTDRQYSRSLLAAQHRASFGDGAFELGVAYVREADDPDATIDLTLSDADRALLASAGTDRNRAVRNGATFVGRNDTVVGTYLRIDTTINGTAATIYRYDPTNPLAFYDVRFSVPPTGTGDYRSVAFGQYEYAGPGLGTHLPVVYLPLPELRQVGELTLHAQPLPGVRVSGELAGSALAINRFSLDPAAQQRGAAWSLGLDAEGDSLRLGALPVGRVGLSAQIRSTDARFTPFERLGEVEFINRWNTAVRPGESGTRERIASGTLAWSPTRTLTVGAELGLLDRGDPFRALRQGYTVRYLPDSGLPRLDYRFERIGSDSLAMRFPSVWTRHAGGAEITFGPFTPGVHGLVERREGRERSGAIDTLLGNSFGAVEYGPDLRIALPFMESTVSVRWRRDDSVRSTSVGETGRFVQDATARTFTLRGALRNVGSLNSTIDLTLRERRLEQFAGIDPSSRLNSTTVLLRSETRWSPFDHGIDLDALYQTQTQQAARLQRIYVRVPFGQGEYVWIDRDSNRVQTEDEFRLTDAGDGEYVAVTLPTDRLYPVVDLRAQFRVRTQPGRIDPESWLAPLTTETSLLIDERSEAPNAWDIVLLRLSRFQQDSTTLNGSATIQQDVNLFETSTLASFRLRWLRRTGLNRLVTSLERTTTEERSLRVRWQPTTDVGLQVDVLSTLGRLIESTSDPRRSYDLEGLGITSDLSYRPAQNIETGWVFRALGNDDRFPATPRSITLTSNRLRGILSIETRGRLSLEIERTVVEGTNTGTDVYDLPYQLTDGYAIGTTWSARAGFDYRFGGNLQASLVYTGRAQPPTMRVLHIGQAELRAFF